jgi:Mg2+ and Co2+ transporter CorA
MSTSNRRRGGPREADLDQAFERLLRPEAEDQEGSSIRILIPGDLLDTVGVSLTDLIESVSAEWEEIEKLLANLREHQGDGGDEEGEVLEDAFAVVSERELADPDALARALAPLQSETTRLEFFYARAKHGLDRLAAYQLSDLTPDQLLAVMRRQQHLEIIRNLVSFLRALNRAAESFEALSLPPAQIRRYLRQLYSMEDWQEMESWVRWLETKVANLLRDRPAES